MILASHVIFSAYGFWLPNDPRGSWSDFVRKWELVRFGKATKVDHHRSVAHVKHDARRRIEAKRALTYPPVEFDGEQALSIANGFKRGIAEGAYVIHACAILPLHVHLVIANHRRRVEQIVAHLKSRASSQLRLDGRHPFEQFVNDEGELPSAWGRGCWKRYRDTPDGVRGAITYVERNPEKEGKKLQHWSFLTPYVG